MRNHVKPWLFTAALAVGFAAPAFGQGGAGTSGGNTDSTMAPEAATAPVTSGSGAPVMRGSAYDEHTAVPGTASRRDEDALEREQRSATTTPEEEHGGLRNRLHQKKDRAREKLGMPPDAD